MKVAFIGGGSWGTTLANLLSDNGHETLVFDINSETVKQINEKVKVVDEKVFGNLSSQATITEDALKYKEELLRKKREKESLNAAKNELDAKLSCDTPSMNKKSTNDIEGE